MLDFIALVFALIIFAILGFASIILFGSFFTIMYYATAVMIGIEIGDYFFKKLSNKK